MTLALSRVFVFDYGALIALIRINDKEKRISIFTKLTDAELIKSMEVVARLIRRYKGQKTFKFQNLIGIFGENYIVVGKLKEQRYAASGFGFIMKILQSVDALGPAPIDMIIEYILRVFPEDYIVEMVQETNSNTDNDEMKSAEAAAIARKPITTVS